MLERVEHRSSPQVQQKGPSCDGAIWWFEIAGEGFEPPTFGLLSQKFDWTLLSFQPTDCRLFRSIHHKIAVRQHNRLSSSSSGCGAKALVHAPISGCPRCSRVMWPGGRSGMLIDFLEKAVATGCDSIEIEYKDGNSAPSFEWSQPVSLWPQAASGAPPYNVGNKSASHSTARPAGCEEIPAAAMPFRILRRSRRSRRSPCRRPCRYPPRDRF